MLTRRSLVASCRFSPHLHLYVVVALDARSRAMRSVLLAALVLHTAPAHAEPDRYLGLAMSFGASEPIDNGYTVMGWLDGGYRVAGPWWLHGGFGAGPSVDRFGAHVPNGGRNTVGQVGAEAHFDAGAYASAFAGVDVGVQHGTFEDSVYGSDMPVLLTDSALVAIPRVGFEVGGERLRARVTVDAAIAMWRDETATMFGPTGRVNGIDLAAGAAYRW